MWLEIFPLAASDRAGVERESKANAQLGNISCAGEPSATDADQTASARVPERDKQNVTSRANRLHARGEYYQLMNELGLRH
jgi:hypothetical protein